MHNFAFPSVLRKDIASRLNPAHLGRKCFVARKGAKCVWFEDTFRKVVFYEKLGKCYTNFNLYLIVVEMKILGGSRIITLTDDISIRIKHIMLWFWTNECKPKLWCELFRPCLLLIAKLELSWEQRRSMTLCLARKQKQLFSFDNITRVKKQLRLQAVFCFYIFLLHLLPSINRSRNLSHRPNNRHHGWGCVSLSWT